MTGYEPSKPNTTDTILRQLIAAAESNPLEPGTAVMLYLPWGVASGQIVSRLHFENTVAGWVRTLDPAGDLGDELTPKEGDTAPADNGDYVHLYGETKCFSGDKTIEHQALRVRLADITAWTVGKAAVKPRSAVIAGAGGQGLFERSTG